MPHSSKQGSEVQTEDFQYLPNFTDELFIVDAVDRKNAQKVGYVEA